MSGKKALVTGITGQDGSYLAEFPLAKGYEVHGLIRKASTCITVRIDRIFTDAHDPGTRPFLHYGDLTDSGQLMRVLLNVGPEEIYHLGAQNHAGIHHSGAGSIAPIQRRTTTRNLLAAAVSTVRVRPRTAGTVRHMAIGGVALSKAERLMASERP